MTMRFLTAMAFACGVAISAGAASASSFNMSWTGVGPYGYPGPYGWTTFETRSDLSSGQVTAGAFLLEGTLPDTTEFEFTAFTTELENALLKGKDYDATSTPFQNGLQQSLSGQQQTDIQSLYDIANLTTTDLLSIEYSSGFQLALFEIVYEQAGTAYNLDSQFGSTGFYATPTATSGSLLTEQLAAVSYGNSLLSLLNGGDTGTGSNSLTYLESSDYSDPNVNRGDNLLSNSTFPAPIPLPASGLFLIAGAGAFAVARRRRKQA